MFTAVRFKDIRDVKLCLCKMPSNGAARIIFELLFTMRASEQAFAIVVLESMGGAPSVGEGTESRGAAAG